MSLTSPTPGVGASKTDASSAAVKGEGQFTRHLP